MVWASWVLRHASRCCVMRQVLRRCVSCVLPVLQLSHLEQANLTPILWGRQRGWCDEVLLRGGRALEVDLMMSLHCRHNLMDLRFLCQTGAYSVACLGVFCTRLFCFFLSTLNCLHYLKNMTWRFILNLLITVFGHARRVINKPPRQLLRHKRHLWAFVHLIRRHRPPRAERLAWIFPGNFLTPRDWYYSWRDAALHPFMFSL